MNPQHHIGTLILLLCLALPVAVHAQTSPNEVYDWTGIGRLIWAVAVGVTLVLLVSGTLGGKRRISLRLEALKRIAAAHELEFSKLDPVGVFDKFPQLDFFQRYDMRDAHNVICGKARNRNVYAFDCECMNFVPDTEPKKLVYWFSVATADLDGALPPVWLRPPKALEQLKDSMGIREIAFESGSFNSRFQILASDREVAFDVVNPQVMQLLLDAPFDYVQFQGAHVAVFSKQLWTPEQFEVAVDLVPKLAEGIPHYLWAKVKERGLV